MLQNSLIFKTATIFAITFLAVLSPLMAKPILNRMPDPSKEVMRLVKIGNEGGITPPQYLVWFHDQVFDIRFNPQLKREGRDFQHSAVAYSLTPEGKDLFLNLIDRAPIYVEEVLISSTYIDRDKLKEGIVPFDPADFFNRDSMQVQLEQGRLINRVKSSWLPWVLLTGTSGSILCIEGLKRLGIL